ncbi:hypothetical protein BG015_005275 [Linnemannia schmuckeri]|uniref:Uncharacterized protein n=1 Tax=Linnemannia schmuckeri TaxID=64567 RepID=A0A9P5R6C4_9FUNG|nr:hypothetical protein BG015_005275 [Linnemannia schmuckeri]
MGPTSCDPTMVTMVLQTYANLKSAACEGIPPVTASGAGGNAAAPPVLPSTTFPTRQQAGNAATISSGTLSSKVAAGLAAISAVIVALH